MNDADKLVNELSNTIDLDVTLVKAEALFKKFQRTVEAIDRKTSFPAPSDGSSPFAGTAGSPKDPAPKPVTITDPRATPALLRTGSRSAVPQVPSIQVQDSLGTAARREGGADKGKGPASPRVNTRVAPRGRAGPPPEELKSPVTEAVSPELRNLLRRDAPWMDVKKLPGPKTKK
jgi:TBC1 domain family member 15